MSTRELKETISKLHEAQEQLTLITAERATSSRKKQSEHEDLSDTVRRLREAESGVRKARRDGHARPTAEEIKQYTESTRLKKSVQRQKDREKAIAEAESGHAMKQRSPVSKSLRRNTRRCSTPPKREKRADRTAGKGRKSDAKLTASPEVAKNSASTLTAYRNISMSCDIIASMDDETTAAKLRAAMQKLGALLQEG